VEDDDMKKRGSLALFLSLFCLASLVILTLPAHAGRYQVFAGNDLGMHCMDNDFSTFALLPPGNSLNAQVILKAPKGGTPRLLTGNEASLFYRGVRDTRRLINTTSIGKTNFWDFAALLYGPLAPAPDVGFLGAEMPGRRNQPKPFLNFNATLNRFEVIGIPMTELADSNKGVYPFNPYSMMQILARGPQGRGNLSRLNIVVPVATEMHCGDCHATGAAAATPGFQGVATWSANPDANLQFRENILILHDAVNNTTLLNDKPVLCFQCHYSAATDFLLHGAFQGPTTEQLKHKYLSPAMHAFHGSPQTGGAVPIPDQGLTTCYSCHPGQKTQCLRGPMFQAGLVCQDCHGNLQAVGGVFNLKSTGQPRTPWLSVPQCQSCHSGDAVSHLGADLILQKAYDPTDPAATPVLATNKRFAENNGLFRESTGHGGVACSACHGSPHAEWATNQPNDNVTANSVQKHPGMITECVVCHLNNLAPTINGPHGMHNVNDQAWISDHHNFYESNPDNCKACHGLLLQGTVLSRTAVSRTFRVEDRGRVTIPQGAVVGCAICHEAP
jgi:hypothetical protein